MSDPIINKVAESGLVTLDLETYYPRTTIVEFDLKPFLFMGMILKEKEFRQSMQHHDWKQYDEKSVAITCSADAIIPVWAYMLVAAYLQSHAATIFFGTPEEALKHQFLKNINQIDPSQYEGQRLVVKGCGETPIGEYAYLEITKLLLPYVKSLMYGEPCSTVPIFKKKN